MGLIRKPLAIAAPPPRPSILDRLGRGGRAISSRDLIYPGQATWARPAVGGSNDLDRILAIPRRPPLTLEQQAELAAAWTKTLHLPNRPPELPGDIVALKPVQGWYIGEAAAAFHGVLGHVRVGGGKTGVNILLAMVVQGCRKALLLIPASLRAQFLADFARWSRHFRVPNLAGSNGVEGIFYPDRPVLTVMSYSDLSHAKSAVWLEAHAPDVVIMDEAQNAKDRSSVRTGRLLRYFKAHPETRLFAHSGSLTTKSLDDFAHLAAIALHDGSPLPIAPAVVKEWCGAIDPHPAGTPDTPLGKLALLCQPGEHIRSGFRRRLIETPGVVATGDARLAIKLVLRALKPKIPEKLAAMIREVRIMSRRPDGEEFTEALEVSACIQQLACGFYYRFRYPRGEPAELIDRWFEARKAWHRELREKLERRAPHLDSPLLCTNAAIRHYAGDKSKEGAPTWAASFWRPWAEIRDQVQPEQEAVWVDRFLVSEVAGWCEPPGIAWSAFSAFGRQFGTRYFGAGPDASERILAEKGDGSIVASIKAHGTGKNLQAFRRNLIVTAPADAGVWEQCIGRTFRDGQRAEVVTVDVFQHVPELVDALEKATARAEYVFQSSGSVQALLDAEREGFDPC